MSVCQFEIWLSPHAGGHWQRNPASACPAIAFARNIDKVYCFLVKKPAEVPFSVAGFRKTSTRNQIHSGLRPSVVVEAGEISLCGYGQDQSI
jgi:hypothetical protein